MINSHYRREDVRRVAVLANIRGLDVGGVFAGCVGSVVAADTIACNVHVIEIRRQPGDGAVAVVTIVATRNMGLVLAGRRHAIVATATVPKYLRVVDREYRRENAGRMAVFAHVGRLYVRLVLANRNRTVVAADTITGS